MERRRDDDRRGRDDRDDDRRGGRDDDRRSSRDRDDDRGSSRGRDRDDRGSRDRDRDDDRGRGRDRDDDRGGRRSGSSSRFTYERRSVEDTKRRQSQGPNDFDKIVRDDIKMWKPNDGDNRIRILPPTWEGAKHFAYDIHVHYGVGPDRNSYLDLTKHLDKPDPITEAREAARRERDPDEKYIKELDSKTRAGIYLIDRDHESEGVQFWAAPWGVDRDIVTVSIDRDSGEVLPIDDPEEGFDILFTKRGTGIKTEYTGVQVARRSSRLGKSEWLDFAVDNPIPSVLKFYDYDQIAKAFNGGSGRERDRGRDDRDDDRGRDSGRGRDRDDRDDDRRGSSRDSGRDRAPAKLDWDAVHGMTGRELEDLVENERLKIDPREARDDDDLADWICDVMEIKKPQERSRGRDDDRDDRGSRDRGRDDDRKQDDDAPRRRKVDDDEPRRRDAGGDDKLAEMRRRREADR